MIFLDNASTTRVFDEVLSTMSDINNAFFYNPSALYKNALDVKRLMEDGRKTLAKVLNVQKNELFFTSCATESNNWILNSGFKNRKGNLVTTMGEHASVFDCALNMKNKGMDIRIAGLTSDGRLDLNDFEKKLDKDTSLVSVIHASNETGAINDIEAVVKIVRKKSPRALIHSDGVQAFCKLKTDIKSLDIDFYTISAHKIGGPKGCGAVYINNKVNITPMLFGGGQEGGLRSGTENVPAIAGFARAAEVFLSKYDKKKTAVIFEYLKDSLIKERFKDFSSEKPDCCHGELDCGASKSDSLRDVALQNKDGGGLDLNVISSNKGIKTGEADMEFIYNGSDKHTGFILSLSCLGIKAEVLQHILSDKGVLIGLGSACSSKSDENRVLSAMGRSKKEIEGNIRLSLGVDTTMQDVVTAVVEIKNSLALFKKNAGM